MSAHRWIKAQFSDHPLRSSLVAGVMYLSAFGVFHNWLTRRFGHHCHWVEYYSRRGPRRTYDCDFEIAPGLDFILSLLIGGGPFYGLVAVVVVIGLPLAYVVFGARSLLRGMGLMSPEPSAVPSSPYGDIADYERRLREEGVLEGEIQRLLRPYRNAVPVSRPSTKASSSDTAGTNPPNCGLKKK